MAEEEEEEGLFGDEESLSRPELRKELKECTKPIPKTGGKKFRPEERLELEKKVFRGKYGSEISETDWRGALRELKVRKNRTPDRAERRKLDEEYRFLKKIGPK